MRVSRLAIYALAISFSFIEADVLVDAQRIAQVPPGQPNRPPFPAPAISSFVLGY
jgi:hypothetical protein